MGRALYTFNHVKAYALIGLHNLLNSGNKDSIDLETLDMFLDPLETVHTKEKVIEFSKLLLKKEKEEKERKSNSIIEGENKLKND
ncbi:MAG: hypothetical protein J6J60_05840 [Clostridia bacterium]|nr:hypothetical protein [Clostridia bacterium]